MFCNYSFKGVKALVHWLFEGLTTLSEKSEAGPLQEIDLGRLSILIDIVSLLAAAGSTKAAQGKSLREQKKQFDESVGAGDLSNSKRLEGVAEDQQLIRTAGRKAADLELFQLMPLLLYWLDYAVEKEERFLLFRAAWKALSDIARRLPKRSRCDLSQILLPYYRRIQVFCDQNSPTPNMLRFLEFTLKDVSEASAEMRAFLQEFTFTIADWVPHNMNEEIFRVLEAILQLIKGVLSPEHVKVRLFLFALCHNPLENRFNPGRQVHDA